MMEMDSEQFMAEYQARAARDGTLSALQWAAGVTVGYEGAKRLAALTALYSGMYVLTSGMRLQNAVGAVIDPLTVLEQHTVSALFVLSYLAVGYILDRAEEEREKADD